MTIWFTADTHYFHANIIRYTNRPFVSVYEMNTVLIDNFNRHVKKGDTVYFVGDFGLAPKELLRQVLTRLNGKKKILIRGNHDKGEKSMLEIGFHEVHRYMDLNMDGKSLLLSHIPIFSRYHDAVLSGHVHDLFLTNGNILNVGVDVWKFCPVRWTVVRDMIYNGVLDKKGFRCVEEVPDASISSVKS